MKDLYLEKDYGKLYEPIEKGTCEVYEFQGSKGKIRHLFIKRPISIDVPTGPFYDLVTPYGYGGPVITECADEDKAGLVAEFKEAFKDYCDEHKIVCEFVRFHPLIGNAQDFEGCYDVKFRRNTIQTNLSDHEDPILSEYSASCRKSIRQALKAGVEYKILLNPPDLKAFKEIYYSTMKRNTADSVYYFNEEYFSKCIELLGENLVVVEVSYQGEVVGMSLNFVYGDIIHAHLTGTLKEFHNLGTPYVLQYALAIWGKENGITVIHHGGGRTGEPDDKLYLFKKKFGRNQELKYFIGEKIWNDALYDILCHAADANKERDDFPAYRQKQEAGHLNVHS